MPFEPYERLLDNAADPAVTDARAYLPVRLLALTSVLNFTLAFALYGATPLVTLVLVFLAFLVAFAAFWLGQAVSQERAYETRYRSLRSRARETLVRAEYGEF